MESLFYCLISAYWEFAPGKVLCSYTHLLFTLFMSFYCGTECEVVYLFCSDLIYDFLMTLANRLTEVDACTILIVLDSKFYYYPCLF